MSLTIGRVGRDFTLGSYMSLDVRGDRVTLSGVAKNLTQEQWTTLRDQLRGLDSNPDEPVIPITSTVDPSLDGFYRDVEVQVSGEPGGWARSSTGAGNLSWSVSASRVAAATMPVVTSRVSLWFRPNNNGVFPATPNFGWAVPAAASIGPTSLSNGNPAWTSPFSTSSGALMFASGGSWTSTAADTGYIAYACPPGHWYDGACQVTYTNAATYTVVGRQLPDRNPDGWALTNGRVKVTSSSGKLVVSTWSGSWSAGRSYYFAETPGSTVPDSTTAFQVLKNSPHEVRGRLYVKKGSQSTPYQIDMAVKRGAAYVECAGYFPAGSGLSVYTSTAETTTSTLGDATHFGGVTGTSSPQFVIGSPQGFYNRANGGINSSAATLKMFAFGIGELTQGATSTGAIQTYYTVTTDNPRVTPP